MEFIYSKEIMEFLYSTEINAYYDFFFNIKIFRVHTLPTTCFTSLSKFIVTVYRKTGHGDHL